ncbi:MAG: permease-like cell division protein FtsX [Bacteroidales bacterium]
MHTGEVKHIKRRLFGSYITSMVSISLVLYMLGLIGFLVLNAKKLSDYVKENIGFTVFLREGIKEADAFHIQKILDSKHYVKETLYITAEQAAREFQEEIGENFIDFLGFNPLVPSVDVKLYANYANSDSIAMIEKDLQQFTEIKEVHYQKSLVHLINENVKKISLFIFLISGILFLIAFALINNTIRLAIYSRRFLIRTMQLVGATHGFIRKPFLFTGIVQGFFGAIIAVVMLMAMIYFLQNELEGIIGFKDFTILAILFSGVLIIGIFINWMSTYFAVNKFLNIKTDKLYI